MRYKPRDDKGRRWHLVARLLAEHDEVVLHVEYGAVGQSAHLEDGTVGTGVEVDERVVREGDVPYGTRHPCDLCRLLKESGVGTVVEGVLSDFHVLV